MAVDLDVKNLPYAVHNDLCRILDNGEEWRELAGRHLGYSAFDINEIANDSNRRQISPTRLVLERWGNLVHTSNELFVLLYRMKHVPAMRCMVGCVNQSLLALLTKLQPEWKTMKLDENDNRRNIRNPSDSVTSIPLPVRQIGKESHEQGVKRQQTGSTKEQTDNTTSESVSNSTSMGIVNNEVMKCAISIPRIPYNELTQATNNWAKENELGKGGFGEVFKGEWKQTLVAIKKLKAAKEGNQDNHVKTVNQEFLRELCLNGYRHDNLLPLYGYSVGGGFGPCLVYQLMSWSLEQRLVWRKYHHPPLTWPQRLRIAVGTARGLQFLHFRTSTALIHGDIKPANILLDPCLEPKIGDFGLARNGPFGDDRTHVMVSKIQGTRYYLPEDFAKSHILSTAVDVFSFGMVLFEMASALRVYDKSRGETAWLREHMHRITQSKSSNQLTESMIAMEDPILIHTQHSMPAWCIKFIMLGLHCTQAVSAQRPNMIEVFQILNNMYSQIQ